MALSVPRSPPGAADAADTAALDDLTAAATSTDADAAATGADIGATHQTLQVLAGVLGEN